MFKGSYKPKNDNGKPLTYSKGDVVLHQGKFYECFLQTQKSPLQTPKNWFYVGMTQNTISDMPPVDPKEGQIWVSTDGTSYIWYKDPNGFQWVQT